MSSSSLLNVGRLERKFLRESAGSTVNDKLYYNDPSFITFRILFDFEPYVSNDEVVQGLLLSEDRDESGISYLRRMGEKGKAEALKEFRWMLDRITNDFPWFFKSISGIDGLWKWGYGTGSSRNYYSTYNSPVNISIACNESVDFKMTALADLYRKASYDRRYFRELLTIDKRRFNMTILVGEARNLRTFINSSNGTNNSNWLDYVSAVAFRCFDCEFDFSNTMPNTLNSEAYDKKESTIGITVHRVQEANSYRLLGYMLGEMKRDLIIKNGGSGASFNDNREIIDYRSLLQPFVAAYENNYEAVINDRDRDIQDTFVSGVSFKIADPIQTLDRETRKRIEISDLDQLDQSVNKKNLSNTIIKTMEDSLDISGKNPKVLDFGVPNVDTAIEPSVEFKLPTKITTLQRLVFFNKPKEETDMGSQIEFNKPTVETSLSEITFQKPITEKTLATNIDLLKPKIESAISNIDLQKPTVDTEISAIDLQKPSVENDIEASVSLTKPTIENDLSQIDLLKPSIESDIENIVSFSIPTVESEITGIIDFGVPSVVTSIETGVEFNRPAVEDTLANVELQAPKVETEISDDINFGAPKVEVKLGS